jgi:hypothetical protein
VNIVIGLLAIYGLIDLIADAIAAVRRIDDRKRGK